MIKGKNIILRLIRLADLAELYDKWHNEELRGLYYPLSFVPEPVFQQEFAKNGFWTHQSKRLLIVDEEDKILGALHCFKASALSDAVELSYFFFELLRRNKGYTSEAVALFVDYLFNNERLNRIQLSVPVGNQASIRVAEKTGFKHEGILRGAFLLNGKDIDMHLYSLLRKEWKA